MALHTCQIQQYDFHHCEQQFEKQCGEGAYAPYNDSWHCSVFFFSFVSLDSTLSCFQNLYNPLQLHRVRDEGVRGVHITST